MIAVASIFGIAWMSDTFVTANKPFLIAKIRTMKRVDRGRVPALAGGLLAAALDVRRPGAPHGT